MNNPQPAGEAQSQNDPNLNQQKQKKKWYKRWWVIVLALIVFFIIIGNASKDKDETLNALQKNADENQKRNDETQKKIDAMGEKESTNFKVGDDVKVASVRWKVLSVKDRGQTLKASDSKYKTIAKSKTTEGKFIQVSVEVENLGKEMKSVSNLNIVDDQNRKYIQSTDTSEWIPEGEELMIISNLNPNVKGKFTDIYEVPADAKGLKLEVGDLELFGNKSALITLGI